MLTSLCASSESLTYGNYSIVLTLYSYACLVMSMPLKKTNLVAKLYLG